MVVDAALESLKITLFVLLMMSVVDYLEIRSEGRLRTALLGGRWRGYLLGAFLGVTPGCLGAFMMVGLYVHGLASFGAIVAAMIATSGDEAFVMLAIIPGDALFLFLILFLIGLGGGWLADFLLGITQIRMAEKCGRQQYHVGQENLRHYLSQHLFRHILLRHGPRVFGWTFGALVLAQIGLGQWRMGEFIENHPAAALAIGALIGMIPESGPSLAVVMLFANGVLPFSVLLANSIVQDGHGMLPLLSHSLKDSIWIKVLNFLIGIAVGGGISLLGV